MAGQRRWRKKAILLGIETVEGTALALADATALLMTNVTFTPLAGQTVSRDLLLPYLGNQGLILTGEYGTLQGDIEIAGAGAAGDIPGYGTGLRICGMSETVEEDTSVTYAPISDGFESGTIFYNSDGVQHVLVGSRGTLTLALQPSAIPKFTFTLTGLIGTITDAALPVVDVTAFQTPVPVSKANTTLSLHGWQSVAESLSIDLGNTVTQRFLIGDEAILISDRSSTGSAVVEARSLATVNWFDKARTRARGPLAVVHGKTAGNIVQVNAGAVEIGQPTEGNTNGIVNYTVPLGLVANGVDPDLSIVVL
jgi:hypothetical protein